MNVKNISKRLVVEFDIDIKVAVVPETFHVIVDEADFSIIGITETRKDIPIKKGTWVWGQVQMQLEEGGLGLRQCLEEGGYSINIVGGGDDEDMDDDANS